MTDNLSNSRSLAAFTGSSGGDRKHEKRLVAAVVGETPLKSRWAQLAWGGLPQKKLVIEETEYKLLYFSNLGVERTFGVFDSISRVASVFIFIYDVTNRQTFLAFEAWRNWIHRTRGTFGDTADIPLVIVGVVPTHRAVKSSPPSTVDSGLASSMPPLPMPATPPPPAPAGSSGPPPNSSPPFVPSESLAKSTSDIPPAKDTLIRQPSAARLSKYLISPLKLPAANRRESDIGTLAFPSETVGSKAGEEIMPGIVRAVTADEARRLAAAYGASFRELRLDAAEDALIAPAVRMLRTVIKKQEEDEAKSPSSSSSSISGDATPRQLSDLLLTPTRSARSSVTLSDPGFVFDMTLCGDSFVGKTSLVSSLMSKNSRGVAPKYTETLNVTLYKHTFEVDDLKIQLRLRDINGTLATEQLTKENIMDTQCVLFVYDIFNRDSFNRLHDLRAHVDACKLDKKWASLLVANKCDAKDAVLFMKPAVTAEEGRQLAQSWNCPFVETSTREGDSATELFRMAIREVRHVYGMMSSETVSCEAQGYINLKVKHKFKKYFASLHQGVFSWKAKEADKKVKSSIEITHDCSVSHQGMADKAGYVLTVTIRSDGSGATNAKQTVQIGTPSSLELETWSAALNAEISVRRIYRNIISDQIRPALREILQDSSPFGLSSSLSSPAIPTHAHSSSSSAGSAATAAASSSSSSSASSSGTAASSSGSDHIGATKAASAIALSTGGRRKSSLVVPADLEKILHKKKVDTINASRM